jgi:hypothetical protein
MENNVILQDTTLITLLTGAYHSALRAARGAAKRER